jgi:AcrR family transcriptional regulator
MDRLNSGKKSHILEVTELMLSGMESSEVHISDVAKLANVGVPTVYYYFESRTQLIAEAQASIYLKLIEPLHEFLLKAETAIVDQDGTAFLAATGDNFVMAWSYGQLEGGWKIAKLLLDVWSDPKTQRRFCELLDVQLERWIRAIESAKELGWIKPDVDAIALITACWTGSMGQAIFSNSIKLIYTPESIRQFFAQAIEVESSRTEV